MNTENNTQQSKVVELKPSQKVAPLIRSAVPQHRVFVKKLDENGEEIGLVVQNRVTTRRKDGENQTIHGESLNVPVSTPELGYVVEDEASFFDPSYSAGEWVLVTYEMKQHLLGQVVAQNQGLLLPPTAVYEINRTTGEVEFNIFVERTRTLYTITWIKGFIKIMKHNLEVSADGVVATLVSKQRVFTDKELPKSYEAFQVAVNAARAKAEGTEPGLAYADDSDYVTRIEEEVEALEAAA